MSDRPKPAGGTCPIIADTPETNKHVEMIQHFDPSSCRHVLMPWVRVDFARRLERERDEARDAIRRIADLAQPSDPVSLLNSIEDAERLLPTKP